MRRSLHSWLAHSNLFEGGVFNPDANALPRGDYFSALMPMTLANTTPAGTSRRRPALEMEADELAEFREYQAAKRRALM